MEAEKGLGLWVHLVYKKIKVKKEGRKERRKQRERAHRRKTGAHGSGDYYLKTMSAPDKRRLG